MLLKNNSLAGLYIFYTLMNNATGDFINNCINGSCNSSKLILIEPQSTILLHGVGPGMPQVFVHGKAVTMTNIKRNVTGK